MTKTKHNKASETRDILLDANIIQFIGKGNESLLTSLLEILRKLAELNYGLAISDILFYELLNTATMETESTMIRELSGLKRYFVTKKILEATARLSSLYVLENIPLDQISFADKVIATTSILTNSLILTTDTRDFPLPFFKPLGVESIYYEKRGYKVMLNVALFEPDLEIIGAKNNERYKLNKIKPDIVKE